MSKRILGIDPGLDGGAALIAEDGILVEPLPTIGAGKERCLDLHDLQRWLEPKVPDIGHAFLELPGMRPGKNSMQSVLKVGRGVGQLEGLLHALGISYELVAPQRWCAEIHRGIAGDSPKSKSQIAVRRLFPGVDLRASDRCTTIHSGMMDALLIAEYGRRMWKSQ